MPAATPLLLLLAGPAGAGKSTLCDRLVRANLGFSRVITTTTRPPRARERDGVDYHFLTPEAFDAKVAAGAFLEWARVHGRERYGSLAASVLEPLAHGESLVANLDVQGVASVRRAAERNPLLHRSLVTVFVRVTPEQLLARIRRRGEDNEAEIARRLATAEEELGQVDTFDYVIDSGRRDEDFAALRAIIERIRAGR